MYYVYILECADGTLYTGITTDVKRRLTQHKAGIGAAYTRSRGAKRVIYTEEHPDRSIASQREAAVKKLSRVQKRALASSRRKRTPLV